MLTNAFTNYYRPLSYSLVEKQLLFLLSNYVCNIQSHKWTKEKNLWPTGGGYDLAPASWKKPVEMKHAPPPTVRRDRRGTAQIRIKITRWMHAWLPWKRPPPHMHTVYFYTALHGSKGCWKEADELCDITAFPTLLHPSQKTLRNLWFTSCGLCKDTTFNMKWRLIISNMTNLRIIERT